jgi:tetratricopeptide (TPR) repeat protein
MRPVWVGCLLLVAGCASAPIRPQDQVRLAAAEALTREGCYDCLIEARDTYAELAVGRARPLVVQRLFEVELLIALREKELAMDSAGAEARAAGLADELAPMLDARRVLALADLVPPEAGGTPRRVLAERSRARARGGLVRELESEVAWLASAPLGEPARQYLQLSVMCRYPRTGRFGTDGRQMADSLILPATAAPPLLRYRAATCGGIRATAIAALLLDAPRFVEANYFVARMSVGNVQQHGVVATVREPLEAAYARFPASPAVTYLGGQFNQLIGDCKAGLRFFDETLALQPVHENGMLGRTVCLTFLKQSQEAIRAATRMIDIRTDNVVDAYYWRAWNQWSLKALTEARADIEAAKALGVNGDIFTLAGQIEYDQDDLDPAEKDLQTALSLSDGKQNCTAAWYLALVRMKTEQWRETAEGFERATSCYDARVQENEARLFAVRANPNFDPDFKQRQITGFEAAIKDDRGQYHAAAFNAANNFVRAGEIPRARPLLEIAAREPSLADLVRQLREYIKQDLQRQLPDLQR